ncbi:hypothetical protein AB0J63_44035 [Streptosporangium canum]|uniref:hypothetical protein n=1 Tax=Streptosporangium canum TaxID=324952 RepID=UPI0034420FA2
MADGSARGSPARRSAVVPALRYYCAQLLSRWRVAVPALTPPALGNICLFYLVPLVGHQAGDGCPAGLSAQVTVVRL